MNDEDTAGSARHFLSNGVPTGQWRLAYDAALGLALTDNKAAARLLTATAEAALHIGDPIGALLAYRSAILLHARYDASEGSAAARSAMDALNSIADTATWLHESSDLQNAMTAAGVTAEGIDLARFVTRVTAALPPSAEARLVHAQALINLASAMTKAGCYLEALPLLAEATEHAPAEAYELNGNIQYVLGLAHAELNHIAEARRAYARARAAFMTAGADPVNLAYVDRMDAAALARTGRYPEALPHFERAYDSMSEHGTDEEACRTLVGLVHARYQLGIRFTSAELDDYETRAVRLSPSESVAMGLNLANIAHRQHDNVRVDRLYRSFAKRARDMDMRVDAAKLDSSYSVVLRGRGELEAAIALNRAAAAVFHQAGMLREVANADNNHALLLEEKARAFLGSDEPRSRALRDAAADNALSAINALDALRHSLPQSADRRALILNAYPEVFSVAIAACFRARRFEEVAALVEKSRVQPVLGQDAEGFIEPAPVAARPGARAVGGSGPSVVLAAIAEGQLGPGSAWIGWWSNGDRLVRSRSLQTEVDVESGPFDQMAVDLLAAALPVVLPVDEDAAGGDGQIAQLLAVWRAASGPLVNDSVLARNLETLIVPACRARLLANEAVAGMMRKTCDQLLWPLSAMLFAERWRSELIEAATPIQRPGVVIAPPPEFGRFPWAVLPLSDPDDGPAIHLLEVTDIFVGLPASLASGLPKVLPTARRAPGAGVVIADSLSDLPYARRLIPDGMTILGPAGSAPATRAELWAALQVGQELLVVNGHVSPGSVVDPASSALMLISSTGDPDPMTVGEFADMGVPSWCVILGCDGAGAATGTEWTGLATGLVWGGAREVVTTTVPVIDDYRAVRLDAELLASIREHGPASGLLAWQRRMLSRWRKNPGDAASAPYRWAEIVVLKSSANEIESVSVK